MLILIAIIIFTVDTLKNPKHIKLYFVVLNILGSVDMAEPFKWLRWSGISWQSLSLRLRHADVSLVVRALTPLREG